MKFLFAILILCVPAVIFAQDAPAALPTLPTLSRIAPLPAMASGFVIAGVTKNAPFTADESGQTVRVMADGNSITENWTGKIARNSLGNTRREITGGKADNASRPFMFDGPGMVTLGTGEGISRVLTARLGSGLAPLSTIVSGTNLDSPEIEKAITLARAAKAGEGDGGVRVVTGTGAVDSGRVITLANTMRAVEADGAVRVEGSSIAPIIRTESKYQSRKESLGTRDFGGFQAEGTRVTITMPAGSVGNERDIEVVSETWFSKELGVVLYSKRSDPRSGETTYQLTNIVRAEPDASLFQNK
ncbi:hypothetical protein BH10ACI2_BH10ACI2_06610 [soil metagenome]